MNRPSPHADSNNGLVDSYNFGVLQSNTLPLSYEGFSAIELSIKIYILKIIFIDLKCFTLTCFFDVK